MLALAKKSSVSLMTSAKKGQPTSNRMTGHSPPLHFHSLEGDILGKSIMRIALYKLYLTYYMFQIASYTLYIKHFILHILSHTLHLIHCILHIVSYTLYLTN